MFFGPWWDNDQALSFFGRPLSQGAAADGSPPAAGAADGDGDYRGPYNSEKSPPGKPDWKTGVAGTIAGIQRRLPLWHAAAP